MHLFGALCKNTHLRGLPCLLSTGHLEATASGVGTGAETESGLGEIRGPANGRCPSADYRRAPSGLAALYAARQRPADLVVAIKTGVA